MRPWLNHETSVMSVQYNTEIPTSHWGYPCSRSFPWWVPGCTTRYSFSLFSIIQRYLPPIGDIRAPEVCPDESLVAPPDIRSVCWPSASQSKSRRLCQQAGRGSNADPGASGDERISYLRSVKYIILEKNVTKQNRNTEGWLYKTVADEGSVPKTCIWSI